MRCKKYVIYAIIYDVTYAIAYGSSYVINMMSFILSLAM